MCAGAAALGGGQELCQPAILFEIDDQMEQPIAELEAGLAALRAVFSADNSRFNASQAATVAPFGAPTVAVEGVATASACARRQNDASSRPFSVK